MQLEVQTREFPHPVDKKVSINNSAAPDNNKNSFTFARLVCDREGAETAELSFALH